MELTPEERNKIFMEEKARLERQELPKDTPKSGVGTVGWIFGGLCVLVVIGMIVENFDNESPPAAAVVMALNTGGLLTSDSESSSEHEVDNVRHFQSAPGIVAGRISTLTVPKVDTV